MIDVGDYEESEEDEDKKDKISSYFSRVRDLPDKYLRTLSYVIFSVMVLSVSCNESGKLQTLDIMLKRFRAGNHRVLLFAQMTKMLNIIKGEMPRQEQWEDGKK